MGWDQKDQVSHGIPQTSKTLDPAPSKSEAKAGPGVTCP